MPLHDWTRVEAGIFHDFHTVWIGLIRNALNEGLLPEGYYALAEQHAGRAIADVLTLHAGLSPDSPLPLPPATGRIALAEAPPRVSRKRSLDPVVSVRRRTLAIRHVSGHRLIALLEIVSPASKDRGASVGEFVEKAASALERGIHLLMLDLFPPGSHDPQGMHGALVQRLAQSDVIYDLPPGRPLTLASYAAGPSVEMYLEHISVGSVLPEMPLFLRPDRYINIPLESVYQAAYRGTPAFWRNVLETA